MGLLCYYTKSVGQRSTIIPWYHLYAESKEQNQQTNEQKQEIDP